MKSNNCRDIVIMRESHRHRYLLTGHGRTNRLLNKHICHGKIKKKKKTFRTGLISGCSEYMSLRETGDSKFLNKPPEVKDRTGGETAMKT